MNIHGSFISSTNILSCVYTIPQNQTIKAGVIFVHAAGGNRLGPHRMFVELADKLQGSGIASLRFDMRGCGDSQGRPAGKNINADIEDLQNAIEIFACQYNLPHVFLFGISRGASVIISILAEKKMDIKGAVLLSTPMSGAKAAAKKFYLRLKEYLYKFTNPTGLKKILSGKVNFKQILKTMVFALTSQKRYYLDKDRFVTKCPLLFIYGSRDPIAADSIIYYQKICKKSGIPFNMVKIKNANHSFFNYLWKQQIIEISKKWFLSQINSGDENVNFS